MMNDRMPSKKVLLVLDDVDRKDQLEALAGDWFKGGSRIIITTRDGQVLRAHRVKWIHNINCLPNEEAISLFSRYAFERYIPIQGYEDLSFKVVQYAAGLPLTLKVLGSFLIGKDKAAWTDTLTRLEEVPWQETLKVLEISYDGLENDQKEIFQDVACFMKGMRIEDAIRLLQSRRFHAMIGLRVLEERSLITISDKRLGMHDSIQELGRNIVRRSDPHEPNKHSRLWIAKEIEELLSDDMGTEATACIRLEWTDLSPQIIMNGLRNLKKLRFLHISKRHNWIFDLDSYYERLSRDDDCPRNNQMLDLDNFPNSLQFLKWESYSGRFLPQTFRANNLVGLELPYNNIMQLWENGGQKILRNLRFLNLSKSKLMTLDLRMTPNLERLDLEGCRDLTRLDVHAGCLQRLLYLNLRGCSSIRSSSFIQHFESFELLSLAKLWVIVEPSTKLSLTGESLTGESSTEEFLTDDQPGLRFRCFYGEEQDSSLENSQKSVSLDLECGRKLESFFGSFFGLQHLRYLTFDGCILELPNDLDLLANLEELNLVSTHIKCLPDSICMLKHLKSLKLESCLFLEELPRDLGQLVYLEKLTLTSAQIKHLPDSICMLKHLKSLKLKSCQNLEELPKDLDQLVCLEKLSLSSGQIKHLPDSICMMKNLKSLKLRSCSCFEELPMDLGQLVCLEKLTVSARIKHLPDSICMMKKLKSLELGDCRLLEKLPSDLGKLECLEKLILTECTSLKDIPNNICNMKRLTYLCLRDCYQLHNVSEELGSLECLKELDIRWPVRHLPHSNYSVEGVCIVGSDFAAEMQMLDNKEAVDNIEAGTGLENQCTETKSNRWHCDRENPITTEPIETIMDTNTGTEPKPWIVYERKRKRGQV